MVTKLVVHRAEAPSEALTDGIQAVPDVVDLVDGCAPETQEYRVFLRDAEHALTVVAVGEKPVRPVWSQPPVRAVGPLVVAMGRRAGVVDPVRRELELRDAPHAQVKTVASC